MASRSPSVTVITPSSRPENLVTIQRTLPKGCHRRVVLDRPNLALTAAFYNYLTTPPAARAPIPQRRLV